MLERPKINCFWNNEKHQKKDIMNARNVKVLVSQNDISYFEIDGSENSFMNNLDMILDIPSITNVW